MRKKKVPPMAATNHLQLLERPEFQKLTELEGALCAKNLLFMKIFQYQTSRWTLLSEKVINVPIDNIDIEKTIQILPRTPMQAGLIGVNIKSRMSGPSLKITKHPQRICPERVIQLVAELKASGNKYYQDIQAFEQYKERCHREDNNGYQMLWGSEDELEEPLETLNDDCTVSVQDEVQAEELNEDGRKEEEYIKNDPVKKFQFKYGQSLCYSNQYPEIQATEGQQQSDLDLAPGENRIPKDIVQDVDWDVKAFPHLHNLDGSNGKDQRRESKLTDKNYFIQRMLNKDQRFSKSPAYLYAATAFLEKKQLNQNMSLAGTRGKKVVDGNGGVSYELNDGYMVLENIRNTPRYWRKFKYEMMAKLENLGAFQIFFTLSSADLRWDENFTAILRDKGYIIEYEVEQDQSKGVYNIKPYVSCKENPVKKPLGNFLKEDADEKLHEYIRQNVMLATRFFNDRLRKFLNIIVQGNNSPLCVDNLSYKIEFQGRGAPHAHGVIWTKLGEGSSLEKRFPNLTNAFTNLKLDKLLTGKMLEALTDFVDTFTTVSTNASEVGEDVSKIVLEVNKHTCTKTCQKYGGNCRFFYPR